MEEWLSFAAKWTLVPLATIAIFEGVRRFSWTRSGRKAAALVLFGIAVLGGSAGSLAWGAAAIESILAVVNRAPPPALPSRALARMTPEEREEKTRILAQTAFDDTGVLITYTSATGQHVRYAPTEKEIRDRQTLMESLAQTRVRVEFLRAQVWMFLIAIVAAATAGAYARLSGGTRREG